MGHDAVVDTSSELLPTSRSPSKAGLEKKMNRSPHCALEGEWILPDWPIAAMESDISQKRGVHFDAAKQADVSN